MIRTERTAAYFVISALFLSFCALVSIHSAFAQSCPTGTSAIGASRTTARAAGIPDSSQCWNPSDQNAGQAAGDAKQFLQQHATTNANISCLNADFAEKLAKLMKAVPGGVPVIRDAYRSPQQQANLPAGATRAGPCQSYHQYGLAADFNASEQTLRWMRSNAAQYGLAPVSPCAVNTGSTCDGGLHDPGHIQSGGPRAGQCGACTGGSGANGTLPPGAGGGGAPSSDLTNNLRSALGMGGGQPSGSGMPGGGGSPSGAGTAGGGSGGQPISASPASSGGGATPAGMAVPPTQLAPLSDLLRNIDISTSSPTSSSPTSDLLSQLTADIVRSSSTTGATTVVPIALDQSILNNISYLAPATEERTLQEIVGASSTAASTDGRGSTFTSPDLNGSLTISSGYSYVNPTFAAELEAVRKILLGILNHLKPFGGNIPNQQIAD